MKRPLLLAFKARKGVGSSGGLGVIVGDNRLMPFRVEFKLTTSPYLAVTWERGKLDLEDFDTSVCSTDNV